MISWNSRYEGWVAGYQAAYDTAKSKLIANNFFIWLPIR